MDNKQAVKALNNIANALGAKVISAGKDCTVKEVSNFYYDYQICGHDFILAAQLISDHKANKYTHVQLTAFGLKAATRYSSIANVHINVSLTKAITLAVNDINKRILPQAQTAFASFHKQLEIEHQYTVEQDKVKRVITSIDPIFNIRTNTWNNSIIKLESVSGDILAIEFCSSGFHCVVTTQTLSYFAEKHQNGLMKMADCSLINDVTFTARYQFDSASDVVMLLNAFIQKDAIV